MEPVTGFETEKILKAKLKGSGAVSYQRVVIDSRNVEAGDVFVAIIGERNDGHDFISQAWERGALGVIVSRDVPVPAGCFAIIVRDTLWALQELARFNRQRYDPLVVGITGSNGKTTTKDLTAAILKEKYPTLKTPGNLNNQYGLPLVLIELDPTFEAVVVEMGMSEMGEIKLLADLAGPNIGVLTNIGPAHLESLGDLEGVQKAKGELIDALPPEGALIFNGDDEYLPDMAQQYQGKKVPFGFGPDNMIRGQEMRVVGTSYIALGVYVGEEYHIFKVPLLGRHNAYNALAAIAVAWHLGIPASTIADGILQVETSGMRMDIVVHVDGYTIIDDAYNSNPPSLKNALEVLNEIAGGQKIVVLGDMLELGEASRDAHLQAGRWVKEMGADWLITRGEMAKLMGKGALESGMPRYRINHCTSNEEAAIMIKEIIKPQDTVLIKGSRGMKMEEIIRGLKGEE